ncbi:hypothetical protein Vafri_14114 [Volvox africanus]|uniref:Uncharacterized protein n=1 Tax=Volvox africanus TaxID=51714 RepID=A0A8J4F7C8_9CHLO|nr:hypothetical protein Vafri_14114 [Volvox africanus]
MAPGGRASSRIPSSGATTGGPAAGSGTEFQFDYGCQFFTASSPAIKGLLDEWLAAGVAAEWQPRIGVYDVARGAVRARDELTATEALEVGSGGLPPLPLPGAPLYVGMPSMAALVAHVLGRGLTCDAAASGWERGGSISLRLNTRVQLARWSREGWHLAGNQWTRQTGAKRASSDMKGYVAGPPRPAETPSSTATGREESWEAGPFKALVLADSQFARPGAPGYVELHGGAPALDELTARMKDVIRVPQFALMLGWMPGSTDPRSLSSLGSAPQSLGSETAAATGLALSQRLPFDALHLLSGTAIQWIARDSSKPVGVWSVCNLGEKGNNERTNEE